MILEQITDQLTETLKSRVLTLFGHAVDRVVLQSPPKLSMGDLATPLCLELAKALKRKPREIAETLSKDLPLPMFVQAVSIEGAGYLNFRFDRGAFTAAHLQNVMIIPPSGGERMIVEHTNINPNKAAHIGHLRNAVLGDTLVRCLKWFGHEVEVQNYIDDTGVQVADIVIGFREILRGGLNEARAVPGKFDVFCWDLYARVTDLYAARPETQQLRPTVLKHLEERQSDDAELAAYVARRIVNCHLGTMARIGLQYDLLPWES